MRKLRTSVAYAYICLVATTIGLPFTVVMLVQWFADWLDTLDSRYHPVGVVIHRYINFTHWLATPARKLLRTE